MAEQPPESGRAATRERLLQAAGRLFAAHRYDEVSIREIAAAAGVNHGSLNYHFAGKRQLYLEVLQRHAPPGADLTGTLHPAFVSGRKARTRAEARRALGGIVRALLVRCMHPPSDVAIGLMQHALLRKDGPDDAVFERVIAPEHAVLRHVLGLLAPEVCDGRERQLLAINVVAQCLVFRVARPVMQRLLEVEAFDEELLELTARRIVATTLRGLSAPPQAPTGGAHPRRTPRSTRGRPAR